MDYLQLRSGLPRWRPFAGRCIQHVVLFGQEEGKPWLDSENAGQLEHGGKILHKLAKSIKAILKRAPRAQVLGSRQKQSSRLVCFFFFFASMAGLMEWNLPSGGLR